MLFPKKEWFVLLLGAAVFGCSNDNLPDGNMELVVGQETDAWSTDPAAATVQLDLVQAGVHTTLANVAAPVLDISLGSGGPQNIQANMEATAFDANGNPVMHGVGPTFTLTGFVDTAFYLFLGRQGFSRPYGALQYEHKHPLLTVWPQQYLFISGTDTAGADQTPLDLYDVAFTALQPNEPALPQGAKSSAAAGTTLLLLTDTQFSWLDLLTGVTTAAGPPAGLTFAEVSGGRTLIAPDGTEYIVGATRSTGDATDKVLQVDADGTLHALVLSTPRLAAAAAFVEGSLVIAGGSATGAGAEVLAPGGTSFTPLALPADATAGAGLAELTPTSAILTGGHDAASGDPSSTRSVDLTCTSDCTTTEIASAALSLGNTQAFVVAPSNILVVGESDDGETHAFSLDVSGESPTPVEQPFRERRAGASAAFLPNGQVAIVGGDAPDSGAAVSTIELFFP
jgi:hypothetical protein